MAQISKGDTFTNGEQVTGSRLNQLVDSSVLLVGAITDQPSITANTLEATDTTIVNDAGSLKEATIGDILNSNLPVTASSVTTSAINGGAGVDIVVTPAATRKLDVAGAFEAESINSVGNATVGGSLTVTGSTTLTGNVVADNGFTSNGVANFTGILQVNGTVGYVLYAVSELALPSPVYIVGTTSTTVATTANFGAKPSEEIWVFKCSFVYICNGYPFKIAIRYSTETIYTGNYIAMESYQDGAGAGLYVFNNFNQEWVVPAGTALAGTTLSIDATSIASQNATVFHVYSGSDGIGGGWTGSVPAPKILIYKYKTA